MTAEVIKILDNTIVKHRNKEYLTCPDDCWCWEVEKAMLLLESMPSTEEEPETETHVDHSHLCSICHINWVDSDNGYDTCSVCLNNSINYRSNSFIYCNSKLDNDK